MDKAPDAFRTISEVADELDLPQHVLRFWESRFAEIRPMKRAGGRRYYRPDDVNLLKGIRHLLYVQGYTIKGVKGILRDKGVRYAQAVWQVGAVQPGDEALHETERLPPDEAARTLFGLLKAPSAPERDSEDEAPVAARRAAPTAAASGLTLEHVRRLQSALYELRECRQLIDRALADHAA